MRRPPLRPLLLLLAVLGTTLGACTDDAELGGPRLGGTAAASIGSFRYSTADLEDEVEDWASNPEFLAQVLQIEDVGSANRRPAQLVAFVLSHRVITEQAKQLAEATGFELADGQVDQLLTEIDGSFPDPTTGEPLFGRYRDQFRRRVATDFVFQQNLANIDPSSVQVPDVAVNPRYGSFEDQDRGLGRVVPPSGPAPPPFVGQ